MQQPTANAPECVECAAFRAEVEKLLSEIADLRQRVIAAKGCPWLLDGLSDALDALGIPVAPPVEAARG